MPRRLRDRMALPRWNDPGEEHTILIMGAYPYPPGGVGDPRGQGFITVARTRNSVEKE